VNTPAAEKLYRLAGEWAGLTQRTLLFDVCCGTGTIGLTLASTVGKLVGIEMVAAAVEDAKKNAELNGIKNCDFVCGKAEAVLGRLLAQYASKVAPADVAAAADMAVAGAADVAGADAAEVEMTPVVVAEGGSLHDVASAQGGDVAAAELVSAGPAGGIKGDADVIDDALRTLNAPKGGPSGMSNLPSESGISLADSHLDNKAMGKLPRRENGLSMQDGVNGAVAEGSRNGTGTANGKEAKEGASKKSRGAQEALFSDIVAIVDPPRCGLHPIVSSMLTYHCVWLVSPF
jgi:tRNA (uracil-5-)-methyltransferase